MMKLDIEALRGMRRNQMSMVFQKFALLPHETVLKNTGMPRSVRGEDIKKIDEVARQWLNRVGLAGFEESYPHQLSGGMQQRVGLARALTSNSELMLMDEAYSALDPLIRSSMQDLLLELQKDLHKTVVFITHDLDEALKLADHLVILKDGEIVQQGDPQEILLQPAADYIKNFIADINRSRVLKARSIMAPWLGAKVAIRATIDENDNLERAIAITNGDADAILQVNRAEMPVGLLKMTDVLRALVPARA